MRNAAARIAVSAGAAFAQIAVGASAGAQPIGPTPTPAACARPNVPASVIRPIPPEKPELAAEQGIQGSVQVVVSLDENSRVVGARIQSSPSTVLNQAAITAARQTTYQTEIRNCRPIAGDYIYSVGFEVNATFSTTASGERTVSVLGEGTVKRAADVAYVQANIVTRDGAVDDAATRNDAAFAALNAKLAALGTGARTTRDKVSVRSEYGNESSRRVEIAVAAVADVARTVKAASSVTFVEVGAIRFTLRDVAPAQRDALRLALSDAEKSARWAIAGQQFRLGAVRQVTVPPNDRAQPPSVVVPFRLNPVVGGFSDVSISIPDIVVHATATVTYAITK